jgi:hypothetical protein
VIFEDEGQKSSHSCTTGLFWRWMQMGIL